MKIPGASSLPLSNIYHGTPVSNQLTRLSHGIKGKVYVGSITLQLRDFCALFGTSRNLTRTLSKSPPYIYIYLIILDHRDYMEQVKDGKIKITGSTYPTFMYDEDAVTVYDPKEIDKGLCRGYFILRVSE